MAKKLPASLLLIVGVMLLVVNAGWAVWNAAHKGQSQATQEAGRYPLLSKRIFAENPNDVFINFVPLRKKIEARLAPVDAPKSFYFEYLPDGTSIRAGADNELVAASLVKLPVVMNAYRAAELGRIKLDRQVTVTAQEIDSGFGGLWQRGAGTKITLQEASRLALEQSDNTAMRVLLENVVNKQILSADEESLAQLDIDYNVDDGLALISAKSYASVLKCLYFACYLTPDSSQRILGYLTGSAFDDGITASIPRTVKVAHKIGVWGEKLSTSDCGIFYLPKRPYVLCVMLGLPEAEANVLMADLSREIYNYVSGQAP